MQEIFNENIYFHLTVCHEFRNFPKNQIKLYLYSFNIQIANLPDNSDTFWSVKGNHITKKKRAPTWKYFEVTKSYEHTILPKLLDKYMLHSPIETD